ncbi:PmoA family protein [Fimbriiglobus ruber]|uniref:Methane oxygenase PmoA n=1 Tax=Fimbriiglobus ruber TaxID=1908690 RepID=A0A225DTR6_9BACT|nr:PmoA family protein [Fimbriiglobus ruber]OWK40579.1 hypothetical protein FRUB_05498 [Fimbriiglobus ruber]
MLRSLLSALALILLPYAARANDPAVRIVKGETELELHAGTEMVAKYQYAGTVRVEKGDGTKPLAKPFFWPLNAPGGVPVTRAYPMVRGTTGETTDHFHQKSGWFCHGDVIPEGLTLAVKSSDKHVQGVDFWSETPGHGRIVCTDVGAPKTTSGVHASIATTNEWRAPDGQKVLDESRTIHLVQFPAGRLIVLDIELTASVCPITFGDTKEGAMGVRVNDAIRAEPKAKTGGVLANSAGKSGEKDVWGYEADWCDYSGTIDGKAAGIAVFDAPTNPDRSAWHARGYGLMAANPFGRDHSGFPSRKGKTDLVKIAKGDKLKLRYGIYTHTGDAAAGGVASAYKTFAEMK